VPHGALACRLRNAVSRPLSGSVSSLLLIEGAESAMLSHDAGHPRLCQAKVMGRIEQTIQFFCRKLRTDLFVIAQHSAKMPLLGHSTAATLFDQVMGRVTTDALRQGNAHGFRQHQAL